MGMPDNQMPEFGQILRFSVYKVIRVCLDLVMISYISRIFSIDQRSPLDTRICPFIPTQPFVFDSEA